jgi:hypothetical protein
MDAAAQMGHQGPLSPGPAQQPCSWLSLIELSIVPRQMAPIGIRAKASAVARGAGEPARRSSGIMSKQITTTGIEATTTSPM